MTTKTISELGEEYRNFNQPAQGRTYITTDNTETLEEKAEKYLEYQCCDFYFSTVEKTYLSYSKNHLKKAYADGYERGYKQRDIDLDKASGADDIERTAALANYNPMPEWRLGDALLHEDYGSVIITDIQAFNTYARSATGVRIEITSVWIKCIYRDGKLIWSKNNDK